MDGGTESVIYLIDCNKIYVKQLTFFDIIYFGLLLVTLWLTIST